MAESDQAALTPSRSPEGSPPNAGRGENQRGGGLAISERLFRIGIGLLVALAIVAAAWFVTGGTAFDQLGEGGVNQSLLPEVGEPAPELTTYDLDGNLVSLSDYRGQPVWLNFWGSWCFPCRAEMPDMQTAYQQLAPEGLALLAVSLQETPAQAASFAELNGVTFTILTDPAWYPDVAVSDGYGVANFPTHIFIDADGIVRSIILSTMDVETAIAEGRQVLAAG